MPDAYFRMLVFGSLNCIMFMGTYLYGKKAHPILALWLSLCSCLLMLALTYYESSWLGLSLILSICYLRILRKPDQGAAFQQWFKENNIYASKTYSAAAIDILRNKKWAFSDGSFVDTNQKKIIYSLWSGFTSGTVSLGKYGHTTTYTSYLAFVFPPGSVSVIFMERAKAAGDRSHYSIRQKIRHFFVPNYEVPHLVTTAADGSFIIEYIVLPDVEYYERRLNWVKENVCGSNTPSKKFSFSYN